MSIANFFSELQIPIFCMPSGHSAPIVRDFKNAGILTDKHISLWRTEYGAGLGAVGYSSISHKPSLLVLTAGPGITNAVTSVNQAYEESLPLIVLGINNFSSVLDRRVGAMHEIPDSTVFFKTITCFQKRISNPDSFHDTFVYALQKACCENRPVYIEIASDILIAVENMKFDLSNMHLRDNCIETNVNLGMSNECRNNPCIHRFEFSNLLPIPRYSCVLTNEFIEDLNISKKPIIIAGYGTVLSNCTTTVEKLAKLINAPLIPTIKAISWFNNTTQNVGTILDRTLTVKSFATDCDLVIAIGTSLSYLNTNNGALLFGGKIYRFISSEPNETNYNINEFRCDAQLAVEAIISAIYLNKIQEKHFVIEHDIYLKRNSVFKNKVPEVIEQMNAIQSTFPENTIFSFDLCLQTYIFQRIWNLDKSQRFVLSFGWGNLGSALPIALGMVISGKEKHVVCICGDGGLNYDIGDLAMLNRIDPKDHKFTIILFNNSSFGTLTQVTNDDVYQIVVPDYSKLSDAFGIKYLYADEDNISEVLGKSVSMISAHCLVEIRIRKDPLLFNRLRYDE
jgi:thiamine pyrophosphate-dependent acetolactate synthase large subunit-like protein